MNCKARSFFALVVLTVLLTLAAYAVNGQHAYYPTDDGWILAYAWRVLDGQIPYRDFVYERTPLSPLIHATWLRLPDGWQFPAGRLAFYFEIAASAVLPALWAVTSGRIGLSPQLLVFTGIGFALAVHNFPPMPWPTVDGVFFSSGGLTALLFSLRGSPARRGAWLAASSALVALAVLSKQTFAPLAVLLVAYAAVEAAPSRSWYLLAAAAVPGLVLAAGTAVALAANDALAAFAQQLSVASENVYVTKTPPEGLVAQMPQFLLDLWIPGFKAYFRAFILGFGAVAFALGVLLAVGRNAAVTGRFARAVEIGAYASYALFPVSLLALLVPPYASFNVLQAGQQVFWLVAGIAIVEVWRYTRLPQEPGHEGPVLLVGVLALSWCASLSWAYQSPILGLGASGLIVHLWLPRESWRVDRLAIPAAALCVLGAFALLNYLHPYSDEPRSRHVADLGSVYPRFGHLYTNAANAARFQELKDLSTRWATESGSRFVVMPNYPLIYFLSGTRNPLSVDWFLEHEYRGNEERLLRELNGSRPVVLIERTGWTPVGAAAAPSSCGVLPPDIPMLVRYVTERWTLVEAATHFCVYRDAAR